MNAAGVWAGRLERGIDVLLAIILAVMTVTVFYQVFGRYVIGRAPAWSEELARFLLLALTLLVPFAQRMFRFGPLHADDLAVTVVAGLATILILEVLKPHWRKRLLT